MYKRRSIGTIAVLIVQAALGAALTGAPARAQQFAVIKQAPVSPVVDGSFDEVWQGAPSVSIDRKSTRLNSSHG